MGCGCGRRRRAATAGEGAATGVMAPAAEEPSPFARLVAAGWRPAGGGQWRRGDEVTTAAKAIAALDLELAAAEAVAAMEAAMVKEGGEDA